MQRCLECCKREEDRRHATSEGRRREESTQERGTITINQSEADALRFSMHITQTQESKQEGQESTLHSPS